MKNKNKIKIPIYISDKFMMNSDLWGITYLNMVENIGEKINKFISSKEEFTSRDCNAPFTKKVSPLSYKVHKFGDIPFLLVRMKACTINNNGMYVKKKKKLDLTKDDEVGSENHWLLLFPYIHGVERTSFIGYWSVFVYADPNKKFEDSVNFAKLFCKKALNFKLKNLKLKDILLELKKRGTKSDLSIKLTSVEEEMNEVDLKFKEFIIKNKVIKIKEKKYEELSFEDTEELIDEASKSDGYQSKVMNIKFGRNEYKLKIEDKIKDAKKLFENVIEESFNVEIPIDKEELVPQILYDESFILSKLQPVVENYIESYAK